MTGAVGSGTPSDADDYFQTLEAEFVRLRGAPLVLSPDDWHLAASWQERHIPLQVVLRAIAGVFATAAARGRGRRIHSLSYCRHAVEEEFARHLDAEVGARVRGEQGAEWAGERLRSLAGRLAAEVEGWPAPARPAACEALAEVRRLAEQPQETGSLDRIESRLAALEEGLLEELQSALPAPEREAVLSSVEERLRPHRSRMTEEAYQRTRRWAVRGEIRRRLRVPRLSLLAD